MFSLLDFFVFVWGVYYLNRVWIGAEFPCGTQFLKDSELFILYFTLRGLFSYFKVRAIYVVIILILFGCYEAILGLRQIIDGRSRNPLYVLTGSFQNPGPYSAYLLMVVVAGLTIKSEVFSLINKSPLSIQRYLSAAYFLLLALPIIILPATWSRAALVALIFWSLLYYRKFYWKWRYVVWGCLLITAITLYFIKQGSADGRMLTWTAGLTTWLHAPWLGVGVGGFRHACAEGIAELYAAYAFNPLFISGNVAEYAFCDILKILVEQGVVGFVLCLVVVILALCNVFHYSKSLFYTMLVLFVFSLFSYPFEQYPYRTIAVMIAAIFPPRVNLISIRGWKRISAAMLIGFTLIMASVLMATEIQVRRNADKDANLLVGIQHSAFIKDYYELLPKENDNPQFIFIFAKILRNAGRYNDSNTLLREGTLISNDPMFYLLQGNNYRDMQCCDLAEEAYLKAYAVMPNRLYPLYQLMMLYKNTGQKTKMKYMARKIVRTRPKVASPATEEIKNKAKALL